MTTTKIIFVRHGSTNYNEKGLMDYQNKAQLTEIGRDQAKKIADIFSDENISAIYSSPLDRCIDTITPLAKSKWLEITKIDDLIEINSPNLQDKIFSCKNYKWDNGYGGGEKISEVFSRVKKVIENLLEKHKGETIVICAHGDITFLGRFYFHSELNYDTDKYTCGKYLENNPEKYDISAMYGVEMVDIEK